MVPPPPTRFAKNGDVRIAYQILDQTGGGVPRDLVVVPGLVSHLDLIWRDPEHAQFCESLARFARVILFDKRGTGLSDRDKGVPDLDTRMADVLAVMDATGARRPAMLALSEGGMMGLLFAATHPERLAALALYGAFAQSPTLVWPPSQVAARLDLMERSWGRLMVPPTVAPSKADDHEFRQFWARFEQRSASPSTARELFRICHEADIGPVLGDIRAPVLVLHRSGDQRIGVEHAHYLAAHINGADFVELAGDDHLPYVGDSDGVVAEIASFLKTAMMGAPTSAAA